MNDSYPTDNSGSSDYTGRQPEIIVAEVVPQQPVYREPPPRRVWLPVMLFVATCLSTLLVGGFAAALSATLKNGVLAGLGEGLLEGLKYAAPLMTILICHEAGHFLQARRYGVHASLPYFIPMPISPIGTFGAVIAMRAHMGDRRALFDIGITGPLAGLVPTLIFCIVGLQYSKPIPVPTDPHSLLFGEPLLFRWLAQWQFGTIPEGQCIGAHPMAFAGWVGLLITALNLMPIGQLDGGHVLYALLREKAAAVATVLLLGAAAAVFFFGYFGWMLMLFLLMLMGPVHPPTADDDAPLGPVRVVLGWLTLAFIPIGFTPTPILAGA